MSCEHDEAARELGGEEEQRRTPAPHDEQPDRDEEDRQDRTRQLAEVLEEHRQRPADLVETARADEPRHASSSGCVNGASTFWNTARPKTANSASPMRPVTSSARGRFDGAADDPPRRRPRARVPTRWSCPRHPTSLHRLDRPDRECAEDREHDRDGEQARVAEREHDRPGDAGCEGLRQGRGDVDDAEVLARTTSPTAAPRS